ncbi:Uncharacterised protein [Bordetella pertussis]|nr:Uncharacterised protein [Bordetella pertussis]
MAQADFAQVRDHHVQSVGHDGEDGDQHGRAVDGGAAAQPGRQVKDDDGQRQADHQCTPRAAPALRPPGRKTSTPISTRKAAAVA